MLTGQELRTWRRRLRLTQPQLGEMLGVGASTLSRWELGPERGGFAIEKPTMLERAMRDVERELVGGPDGTGGEDGAGD